jgi:outer membrane protein assembly factor BamC
METDWAENRAKIPQDFIRIVAWAIVRLAVLHLRARQVSHPAGAHTSGETEIFISHRGMIETYTSAEQKGNTVWQPRAIDPELEAEFLRRLMVKLGASPEAGQGLGSRQREQKSSPVW